MADSCNNNIHSIDENGSVSHSHRSRRYSDGSSIPNYSRTYSHNTDHADLMKASTVESYSEIFESATRESIDETHSKQQKQQKRKTRAKSNNQNEPNRSRQSITWTNKYTKLQIDKSRENKSGWDEMMNLEQLYSLQMINTVEYKLRKRKLIDSMTGTKVNVERENKISQLIDQERNSQHRVLGETEIIKKIVNFSRVASERAIRHSCHIQKINKTETKETWSQDMTMVKMASNPFNNGTLRYVYYMQDMEFVHASSPNDNDLQIKNTATHVAKISIDPMEEVETYFHDVAMQKHAQRFADEFNKNQVPKKVGFLDCFVYELVDRSPHIFCGVEKLITGNYHKYTNNWDWVNQSVDRNTPSAFSHFTFEASRHKILICDLQGVGDLYTDPQMHTFDGNGCGKGNMGKRGIDKFLSSHKCNAICTYLKLPHTNLSSQFTGTLPQKRYMENNEIDQVPVTNGQYTVPDTTTVGATTRLLQQTSTNLYNDESDDDEVGGGYPFGKRIDLKDAEKTKCWCLVL